MLTSTVAAPPHRKAVPRRFSSALPAAGVAPPYPPTIPERDTPPCLLPLQQQAWCSSFTASVGFLMRFMHTCEVFLGSFDAVLVCVELQSGGCRS
jgi:hypothetical protein